MDKEDELLFAMNTRLTKVESSQGDFTESFITANPPFKLKVRYSLFGFCIGVFTAGTTGILWKMR